MPSNPYLILSILCLHKDLHATMKVPPEPWPNVVIDIGDRGLEGGSLCWCGRAAPVRGLPGLLRLHRQGSCRGNLLCPSALCGLVLWCCLVCLVPSAFLQLPSFSLLCVAMVHGSDCPCTSKGVKRRALLLYTDRSPRAWVIHKRDTLLGQAQNGARAGGADFYCSNLFVRCASA